MSSVALWVPGGRYTAKEFKKLTDMKCRIVLGGPIHIIDCIFPEDPRDGGYFVYAETPKLFNSGDFKTRAARRTKPQPFWTKDWRKS